MNDYIPQDRNPNTSIFGFGSNEAQDLRNELRVYDRLLRFFKDPEQGKLTEKPQSVSDKINQSFVLSELVNFGPIGRLVARGLR